MNRNGVQNVQFHDSLRVISGGNKKFDIVLLDVPCSGGREASNCRHGAAQEEPRAQVELLGGVFGAVFGQARRHIGERRAVREGR